MQLLLLLNISDNLDESKKKMSELSLMNNNLDINNILFLNDLMLNIGFCIDLYNDISNENDIDLK